MNYLNMTKEELEFEYKKLLDEYEEYQKLGLNLNMARGKQCKEQLDLSNEMLTLKPNEMEVDGIDIRNYGCLDGLPSAKKLFAEVFQVDKSEIFIGGNSSLNLMYDLLSNLMLLPGVKSGKPWCKCKDIKFLCPVPGYDRHFAILESLGIKMINVDMTDLGPDMDQVEALVKEDPSIKGMICVPKYSNPTGVTYSNDVVHRLVSLKARAKDFVLIFDNAYAEHHLFDIHDGMLNILEESKKVRSRNRIFMFASTSKMTFSGAGLSFIISTSENIDQIRKWISVQTIGYDKINQIKHVMFFKDASGLREHMKKHAEILRPKFKLVDKVLSGNLSGSGLAKWSKPYGGYFISLDTLPGCAKRVVELCKNAGVIFTDAGATFPYKIDPKDSNIRIAPTYPPLEELETAMNLFCLSIKIASLEKDLSDRQV